MTAPARAATVLCLRPIESDVEVLLVRRSARATFMANAYVFPGGRVDDADAEGGADQATRRCAARELLEEASLRVASLDELVYFARWITPSAEPKRFDADFFLWALPADQAPVACGREVFDLRFYTPAAALAAYESGALNLPPPTACTLEELRVETQRAFSAGGAASGLARLLSACRARRPHALMPRLRADKAGGIEIVMPWDPDYAAVPGDGEPATALAEGAAPVPRRISRCTLAPPGVWRLARLPG